MQCRALGRTGLESSEIGLAVSGSTAYRRDKFIIQGHLCTIYEEEQYT